MLEPTHKTIHPILQPHEEVKLKLPRPLEKKEKYLFCLPNFEGRLWDVLSYSGEGY